jgi:thiol-disulfide isomerase/thioredoxin
LDGTTGWLNSEPLTPAGLRGKVVLAGFWTYTCINWLRQLPYLRAWAEKYSGHGLVVIGVHTPEFSFEHNAGDVRRAVQDMRITYPVATDNDYAVWRAFDNHYWSALYVADAQGESDTTTSARANTASRKWSSSNCWPRPDPPARALTWSRSPPAAWKSRPTGPA